MLPCPWLVPLHQLCSVTSGISDVSQPARIRPRALTESCVSAERSGLCEGWASAGGGVRGWITQLQERTSSKRRAPGSG